jgi:dTDP-4-dehydrorhamnose reductase
MFYPEPKPSSRLAAQARRKRAATDQMRELELWGGHECTVNRIGERYFDQTLRTGHHDRSSDLERFAGLGLKALRYPVIWERTAPDQLERSDFSWSDARISRILELGVRPIIGLVHHGSGPRYTNLIDDGFVKGLAAHARNAAERYSQVRDWTPINEPLTTARFSCLYGHWYPHQQNEHLFWLALLNQIDAIRLAMREIRAVRPDARLIQTEDLGRTYATRPVARQADFENGRRWLTWDLLSGRVTRDHLFWERIAKFQLQGRLAAIADDPCPPDIVGVNHYLTSERFLDHRLDRYPPERHGGNQQLAYADVEAIRVLSPGPHGLEGVLSEAWDRYRAPLAVTECHNGCTREEQLRWVVDAWDAALRLRQRGVAVEAVTAWALLGAYDWNSLLTREAGYYEPGAFDIRGGTPRPTALAGTLQALANPSREMHPASAGPGWWRRDVRLEFLPVLHSFETSEPMRSWRSPRSSQRPLLITGATGTLGKALARGCRWRGLDYVLTDRSILPLDNERRIEEVLDALQPWAVINAAGWVRVDEAELRSDACHAANADGAVRLARAAQTRDIAFVGFSSDLVFDGAAGRPYVESDPCSPLGAYGHSKAKAETEILNLGAPALMIRTAAFFSPFDPHNFAMHVHRSLAVDEDVHASCDCVVSPTFVPDLVNATLDLLIDGETGLWHLASPGAVTWEEFARMIARASGFSDHRVRPADAQTLGWVAPRPSFAALSSERAIILPPLGDALARHVNMLRTSGGPESSLLNQAPERHLASSR